MKVYLAGGINGLSDSDAKDWRELAKSLLVGIETLDPMRRDYRGVEAQNVYNIVRGDLDDIKESSIVIAMCPRPSWGTAMEIFHAFNTGKTVYVVTPPDGPVSPWLQWHSHMRFASVEDACARILRVADAMFTDVDPA